MIRFGFIKGRRTQKRMALLLAAALLLGGCGAAGHADLADAANVSISQEQAVPETAEEPQEKQDAAEASGEETKTEADQDARESVPIGKNRLLPGYQVLFEVQGDGTLRELLDVGNAEYIMYADAGEAGCYAVTESRESGEGAEKLYYVDPQGTVVNCPLYLGDSGNSFVAHSFAVVDGKLVYHLSGDDPTIYAYDPESGKIAEDTALTDLQKKLQKLIDDTKWALKYNTAAPAMLERSGGFLLTDNDGYLYRYDAQGEEIETWNVLMPSAWYIPLDENTVAGLDVEIRDGGNIVHGFIYNPAEHTIRSFTPGKMDNPYASDVIIGTTGQGRYVYYLTQMEEGNAQNSRTVRSLYCFDTDNPETGEQEVFSATIPSGFSEPYATDDNGAMLNAGRVCMVGEDVYYLDYLEDEGFVWMKRPLNMSAPAQKAGGVDSDLPYAAYGRVVREKEVKSNAEYNGKEYFTRELERFIVRDDVPGAAGINAALEEVYARIREMADGMEEQAQKDFFGEESEEGMVENIPGYSYTFTFTNVTVPAKNYLQISFDGYEYWGGAHGMPFRTICLFDERTGKRLELADLFPGDEEAFKDLVADYTLEDWKKDSSLYYESYNPDDTEQISKQRESFRESASLSMDTTFEENGIRVSYSPYAVAPYAAGYVDIFIPYDALGFHLQ
ncbi:MAG: DUF3298 and DUF4163 domain-containing protein [Lachnospiraceae bacterium]|nr:DUF3298 and DUF4163 domain-containing protein [Lachnospiraceae bacterium]